MKMGRLEEIGRIKAYPDNIQTQYSMRKSNEFFKSQVEVTRIRLGNRQTTETLINEEALIAKFLRNERKMWIPRMEIL